VEIATSVFRRIASPQEGGAIQSSVPLTLFNCLFQLCTARIGGAVAAQSELSSEFVTLLQNTAHEAGGFDVRSFTRSNLTVTNTLLTSNSAEYFSDVYRSANGTFTIRCVNSTSAKARGCVGCLETKFGSFEMFFSILDNSTAAVFNGGICTRDLDSMTVESCIFKNCRHVSQEGETAAVFLLYENPYDSACVKSSFLGNDPNGSYTVTVSSGSPLLFSECCFTGAEGKEIHPKNYVLELCSFEIGKCQTVDLRPLTVGVQSGLMRPRATPGTVQKAAEIRPRTMTEMVKIEKDRSGGAWAVLLVAAAVIGCVVVVVFSQRRRMCQEPVKAPKALE
jgi:hypothetical protein